MEFLHLSFNGETSSKIIKYQLLSATMMNSGLHISEHKQTFHFFEEAIGAS